MKAKSLEYMIAIKAGGATIARVLGVVSAILLASSLQEYSGGNNCYRPRRRYRSMPILSLSWRWSLGFGHFCANAGHDGSIPAPESENIAGEEGDGATAIARKLV